MQEMIVVKENCIGSETVQTVNARDLHSFLGSKRKFSDWMKERIDLYGFTEGTDYLCHKIVTQYNQVDRIEYHLALDMAKEICMVERNEKGKQARQYFIECERRAKQQLDPIAALNDPAAMRSLLLTYSEKVIERDKLIAYMQPQVEALHQLECAEGHYNLTTAAKVLGQPPHKFPQSLELMGWLYRMGITGPWTGRQEKINVGYLVHKIYRQEMPDGTERSRAQVMITPKGMARLAVILKTLEVKQAA